MCDHSFVTTMKVNTDIFSIDKTLFSRKNNFIHVSTSFDSSWFFQREGLGWRWIMPGRTLFSCSSSAGRRCCRACGNTAPRCLASPSSPSGPWRRTRPLHSHRLLQWLHPPWEGGNLTWQRVRRSESPGINSSYFAAIFRECICRFGFVVGASPSRGSTSLLGL